MSIYTASFFQSHHHHGKLIPISRGIPPQYRGKVEEDHPLRWLLAPSQDLLDWWKRREQKAIDFGWDFPTEESIDIYRQRYWMEIKPSVDRILGLVNNAVEDETWLCWEAPGEFCHRNLAFGLVEKFAPHLAGGQDLENEHQAVEPEIMPHLCHAEGCDVPVPPKMLMCKPHWGKVPKVLQSEIWRLYRPGQEVDKNPTPEYLDAMQRAINAVASKLPLEDAKIAPDELTLVQSIDCTAEAENQGNAVTLEPIAQLTAEAERLHELCEWFLANKSALPEPPFKLEPWSIALPGFYDRLLEEIEVSIECLRSGRKFPRAHGLTNDLAALKVLQNLETDDC